MNCFSKRYANTSRIMDLKLCNIVVQMVLDGVSITIFVGMIDLYWGASFLYNWVVWKQ